jgi:hypothetical protein
MLSESDISQHLIGADSADAILITDKDGVILMKAEKPNLPTRVTKAALSATFSLASEQVLLSSLSLLSLQSLLSLLSLVSLFLLSLSIASPFS